MQVFSIIKAQCAKSTLNKIESAFNKTFTNFTGMLKEHASFMPLHIRGGITVGAVGAIAPMVFLEKAYKSKDFAPICLKGSSNIGKW